MVPIKVTRDDEEGNSFNNTCDVAKSQSFSAIVDLTWGGWYEMKMEAQKNGMPYVRLEGANHQFVKVKRNELKRTRGKNETLCKIFTILLTL